MTSLKRSLFVLSLSASLSNFLVSGNIIYDGQIADSYDFVIAGGGVAGLVLASRLSEVSNNTVLVLEAGDTGDAVSGSIDIPGNAYYSSLLGTPYDWQYNTVPQPNAGGNTLPWPRGKVLGGSSAINGLYLVRPNKIEVDAWAGLIAESDGTQSASKWNWDSLFTAMKKSETFTPPSDAIQQEGGIEYNLSSHGTTGPLHYSYPGYILPVVGNWTTTLDAIGIPPSPDASSGEGWGGFIATSAINPANWTRSYSRSAYIDTLPPRANLAILVNATVTRLLFDTTSTSAGLNATGVEFAPTRGAARRTVRVNKEVILAGGAVGSPHILMHSGVGPRDVLEDAGVTVNVELPGVGQHLQDHLSTQVVWRTSVETAASMHQANAASPPNGASSPFLSFINSATAYANISNLLGPDLASTFQAQVQDALNSSAATLVPSNYPEVVAGYRAIYQTGVQTILPSPVGQVELLLSLTGTAVGGDQSIAIQAALQHPFSQGRLYINSSEPFDYPVIDPQYLSHPADTVMLREGLKLARKLGGTAPLSFVVTDELSPGSSVSTDDEWDQWLAGQVGTEYHPSCTCAMLPQSQGGVVDSNLKVYGLANVRVADSSVYPIQFAAHLQAPTYGLAEQAADIIKAQYNGINLQSTQTSPPSSAAVPAPTTKHSSATPGPHASAAFAVLALALGMVYAL